MWKQVSWFIVLASSVLMSGCSQSDDKSATSDWKPSQEVIVINGHTLPPEPNPAINNATLLGVDSNNNGVRDDVERKIYFTYDKKISQKLMMQSAKTDQAMLADPDLIKNPYDWQESENKNFGCKYYLFDTYNIPMIKISKFINNNTYNTKDRIRKYMKYNNALSGGVFGTPASDEVEASCDFNVREALEDMGL